MPLRPSGRCTADCPRWGRLVLVRLCHPQPFGGKPGGCGWPWQRPAVGVSPTNHGCQSAEAHARTSPKRFHGQHCTADGEGMLRWEPRQEAKPPVPLPRSILQSTGTSRAPSTPGSRVPAQEQPRQRQDYHQLHFTDKRPRRGEIKGLILRVTEGVRGCAHGSRHGGHAGRCLIRAEHTGSGLPPPKGPPPQ